MPNAILAKSGGSKAQWGGVSPTRRARESSDFYEGKIMWDTPCAARGAEPLAFLLVLGGGALRGGWTCAT